MEWKTLYISGKTGFENALPRALQDADVNYIRGAVSEKRLALYWIDEKTTLRDFKKAISAKTIFKYRMHFYDSLEDFIESRHNKRRSFSDSITAFWQ